MTASPFLRDAGAPAPAGLPARLYRSRLPRMAPRTVLWIAIGIGVLWMLAPQVKDLVAGVMALELSEPAWVAAAVGLVGARYAASAMSLQAATPHRLAFVPTLLVQLASSFVGRLTPEGVGWVVLNQRFLERAGLPRSSAMAALTIKLAAGAITRFAIAIPVAAAVATADLVEVPVLRDVALPDGPAAPIGGALVATALAAGAVLVTRRGARRLRDALAPGARDAAAIVRRPRRLLALLGTTASLSILPVLTLWASVATFGVDVPMAGIFAVYLGGTAVAALSPTPGNLGALELTLTAGLTAIGVPSEAALGGVLVYRLVTFWLPVLPGFLAFRRLQQRGEL